MPFIQNKPLPNRLLRIAVVLIALLLALQIIFMVWIQRQSDHGHVGTEGKSLGGEYSSYQGKIYMGIGFQGDYILPQADAASFENLSFGVALGKDKNAVYCGSRTIPGLSPQQIAFVSDGYISDGRNAWFCSEEKPNPDYHWWQMFTRNSDEDSPDKPRKKDYQLIPLKNADVGKLKTIANNYAYDDKTIFYEGVAIAGADAAGVQTIMFGFGELTGRESDYYLRDSHRVYYKGVPLAGANPEQFVEMRPNADQWRTDYGFDASSGKYYWNEQAFPDTVDGVDAHSLKLLIADRDRAHHELFYNGSGIWYWDYQGKGLQRACANPFHLGALPEGKPDELTRGVWADKDDTFIVEATETWRSGRSYNGRFNGDTSLSNQSTELLMLRGVSSGDWKKIGDVTGKDGDPNGTLWQARGISYYAPPAVMNWGYEDALYQVTDVQKLKDYIAQGKDDSNLRGNILVPTLVRDKILIPAQAAQSVCHATSYYPSEFESLWK